MVTVNNILNKDIFGVQKYMNWGATNKVFYVRYSKERKEYIDAVLDYCRGINVRNIFIQSVQRFCEELLMNAIYDAPRDQDGNEIYAKLPRTQQVLLRPEESARLEVACDGERIGISVTDSFGAISNETIVKYLLKGFDKTSYADRMPTSGGAGLGLYICYNSVSHFAVNVSPNRRTEFIGIFDLSKSVKEYKNNHASFNFFTSDRVADHLYITS